MRLSLTSLSGPAPSSGDTSGSGGDAGAGAGQTHRRHGPGYLNWRGQLQKGDVVVEVLGVVVGMRDGLYGNINVSIFATQGHICTPVNAQLDMLTLYLPW